MSIPHNAAWLFTPADNARALRSPNGLAAAHRIIDLEDGCSQVDLDSARRSVAAATPKLSALQRVFLRIHRAGPDAQEDIASAVTPALSGVVLPKVLGEHDVLQIDRQLEIRETELGVPLGSFRIGLLIETSQAIMSLTKIASASSRIRWLMVGELDLAAELEIAMDSPAIAFTRASVLLASAACGLEKPIAAPRTEIGDDEGLRRHAGQARGEGFGGMLCVHPRQVAPVAAVFHGQSQTELAWARRVLAAADEQQGSGAFLLDEQVIDVPVVSRARAIVNLSEGRERNSRIKSRTSEAK